MGVDRLIADPERIQGWMHERSGLPFHAVFRGLAREIDGEIVAAFGYDNFQDWSCTIHIATASPTAINRTLLRYAFEVPFNQWQYKCLIGIIAEGNKASRRVADKLGFTEFAILPDAHPSGSLRFFRMYKGDCRWLKLAARSKS